MTGIPPVIPAEMMKKEKAKKVAPNNVEPDSEMKRIFNPKLSPEEQLIVTMIALSGMILGVILFAVYMVGWVADTWVFKALIIFNAVCGVMFLGANLYGIHAQREMMKAATGFQDMLSGLTGTNVLNNGKEVHD